MTAMVHDFCAKYAKILDISKKNFFLIKSSHPPPFVLPSLVLRLSFAYPSLFLRYHSGESASYKRSSEQEANTHPRSYSFSVNNVRMQFYLEYLENTGDFEKMEMKKCSQNGLRTTFEQAGKRVLCFCCQGVCYRGF